ncbi:sodium:solute symporter family protein [Aquisphaera insulae]|uniref:sodium:solute symporter family protein n=1 Tax=Aquisphaera insulae TaxID=2712864 RepID=UPI0013ED67AF|nr:sodium:solute symporter family protein [Aquisphaera insulae]
MTTSLAWIDYLIMLIYLAFVLGIGVALKRFMKTSEDFFLSGRSIPAWVAGLAFISANLGAQEVIGMAASGAKYGIATSHFYWVGAIPAMVFVGLFMMPFYYGSRAHSVPEYLRLRFDEKTRGLNAITFAVMTVFSSGISMYAMAKLIMLLHLFDAPVLAMGLSRDWIFHASIVLSAVIVLGYVYLGGLTSAIYNEVLQFFLIVAGFLPLVLLGLKNVGGWSGLRTTLDGMGKSEFTHTWVGMGHADTNPLGVEWFGLVMGLGFVLSFGYWCTDFLVVQRAMAADSMTSARRTPLIAAVPKMFFPFLVILPGLLAIALPTPAAPAGEAVKGGVAEAPAIQGLIPAKVDYYTGELELDKAGKPVPDYDMAIPRMLLHYFPTGILGLGLTALLASFMSGMAGNVTAFNTVWTYDIYKAYVHPGATDNHYLWMGRFATLFGTVISIGAAYLASRFNNIMDALQLVFGFVNAPLFATFLLGMFWKRASGDGAFWGLLSGTGAAAIFHGLNLPAGSSAGIKGGWITGLFGAGPVYSFPTDMAQNFWMAIAAWVTCFLVTIVVSVFTQPRPDKELVGLVYALTDKPHEGHLTWYQRPVALGLLVLGMTLALNFLFY